jgi:hypothetical protein
MTLNFVIALNSCNYETISQSTHYSSTHWTPQLPQPASPETIESSIWSYGEASTYPQNLFSLQKTPLVPISSSSTTNNSWIHSSDGTQSQYTYMDPTHHSHQTND